MNKYQETLNTWNKIASLYNEKFMQLPYYNASYDYICQALSKPKAKILDVGCGPGNITHYLLSKRPDYALLGIDIAEKMIELARENNPTAQFAVMDSRQIDQLNTAFDGVVAGFCLPYLSPAEAEAFIFAAYKLLNQAGLIYLSFVEGDPEQSDFKTGSGGRVYFYYHQLQTLLGALEMAKFEDITTFKVPYKVSEQANELHTIVVARKY